MGRDLQAPGFGGDQGVFVGLRGGEGACRIQLSQLIFEHAFNIRLGAASPTAIRRVTANGQHPDQSGQHPSDPDNISELKVASARPSCARRQPGNQETEPSRWSG
jgi:hypothetical protein